MWVDGQCCFSLSRGDAIGVGASDALCRLFGAAGGVRGLVGMIFYVGQHGPVTRLQQRSWGFGRWISVALFLVRKVIEREDSAVSLHIHAVISSPIHGIPASRTQQTIRTTGCQEETSER